MSEPLAFKRYLLAQEARDHAAYRVSEIKKELAGDEAEQIWSNPNV